MSTQSHAKPHTSPVEQPVMQPVTVTRDWDMMLRTRTAAVHLTRALDPTTLTSTTVLLDRTPLVEGGQPLLRDTLLVLTTVHRDGTYQSLAGVVVRQQFNPRTILSQPTRVTLLDSRPGDYHPHGLSSAHEDALGTLAVRYREPAFRDQFSPPA